MSDPEIVRVHVHVPVSRRTLLSAAAWSAPVIVVTAAAPAAAASGTPSEPIAVTWTSAWTPARRRFEIYPQLRNATAEAVVVMVSSGTFAGATYSGGWSYVSGVFSYSLAPGESTPAGALRFSEPVPADLEPGESFTIILTIASTATPATSYPVTVSY